MADTGDDDSISAGELAVFFVVVAVRIFVPLFIIKWPLPTIIAALVADAIDQTVFQKFAPGIDISGGPESDLNYQGYDKALDIYYLNIAFLSTFRNWTNPAAVLVACCLWYYRLIGVTIFEFVDWRPLLVIFPNTFEYFFIFMEMVRLGWNDTRLTTRQIIQVAAFIWIVIKLPQEYWLHVAQMDVTDTLAEYPWLWGVLFVALIILGFICVYIWRRLPPQDHPITVNADKIRQFAGPMPAEERCWHQGLVEKILLVSLVSIIFTKALEGDTSAVQIFVVVLIIVAPNFE